MKLSDPVLGGPTTEEGKRREAQRAAVARLIARLDHLVGLCAATVVLDEISHREAWLQGLATRVEKLKAKGFTRAQGLLVSAKPVYRAITDCREKLDGSSLGKLAEQVRRYYDELNNLQDEHLPDRDVVENEAERMTDVLRDLEATIQGVLTECRTPLLGIKGKIDSVEELIADLEGAYAALDASSLKLQDGEVLVGAVMGELTRETRSRSGILFICSARLVFETVERSWLDALLDLFTPRPPRREVSWDQSIKQISDLSTRRDDGLVSRVATDLEIETGIVTFRGSPEDSRRLLRILQVLKPSLRKSTVNAPAASPTKNPETPSSSAS